MSKRLEMLWQDHGTEPLKEKIARAVEYYQNKYGLAAQYVLLPARDIASLPAEYHLAGRPLPSGQLAVRPANLPAGHMIIGHQL